MTQLPSALAFGLCASILGAARASSAQAESTANAAPFGSGGQFVVTGGSEVSLSSTSYSASQASNLTATFSPGLDYFVARNIAVGINVDLSYGNGKGYGADGSLVETKTKTIAAGPRVAVNVPLGAGNCVSLYPRLTLGFERTERDEQLVSGSSLSIAGAALGYPTTTQTGPTVELYVPLLFHPTDHFFMGIGPSVFHDFGHAAGGPDVGGERTQIGGSFVVGGYFGGERGPTNPDTDAAPKVPPVRRFGRARQWVLTNDLVASISSTQYVGTASSAFGACLDAGFDYFVVDDISIGAAAFASYGKTQGIDAISGAPVTSTVTGGGVLGRVGFNVPMGPWLSWFPRASLIVAVDGYDEVSGFSEDQYSETIETLAVFAPLLVHLAPHFFAGFGPSASHDVSRSMSFPNAPVQLQNQSTTVGMSLTVGGWL